jgi:hypothetical protein
LLILDRPSAQIEPTVFLGVLGHRMVSHQPLVHPWPAMAARTPWEARGLWGSMDILGLEHFVEGVLKCLRKKGHDLLFFHPL